MFWYATRKTMALAVNSERWIADPYRNRRSRRRIDGLQQRARALEAEPAVDAETVSRELGALIMDIQQRGDMIVEKWQAQPGS